MKNCCSGQETPEHGSNNSLFGEIFYKDAGRASQLRKLDVQFMNFIFKKKKKWQPETIQKRKLRMSERSVQSANTAVTIDTLLSS